MKEPRSSETSLERYRDLFNRVPIGLYRSTPSGQIIEANPALARMLKYPDVDSLLNINAKDLFLDVQDRDHWQDQLDRKGYMASFEVRLRCFDGSIIWVEEHTTAIRDDKSKVLFYEGSLQDITRRKRVTHDLEEHQRILSTLMSNLPGMAYKCKHDEQRTIEFLSDGCVLLTGYNPRDLVHNSTVSFAQIIHPEDLPVVREKIQLAVDVKSSFTLTYRISTASNHERWVWEQGWGTYSPDGTLLYLEGFITDITDQKLAQLSLQESETKFKTLYESTRDAILLLEGETFVDCNSSAADIFGCLKDDLIGKSPIDFSPEYQPDGSLSSEKASEKISAALAGKPQVFEWQHLRKDRTPFDSEVRLNHIDIGGTLYLQTIVRDISEYKRAERTRMVLLQISESVNEAENLETLLERVRGLLGKLIDTTNFYVALYDEASDSYTFPYCVDEFEENDSYTPQQLKKSLTDYVRRTGQSLLVDDDTFKQLCDSGEVTLVGVDSKSWLGVPLTIYGKHIGVMAIQSYNEDYVYDCRDLELMTFVSDHIATAIERKQAEEALRRREELFRAMIVNSYDVISLCSSDGSILYKSPSVTRYFGWAVEELVGQNIFHFIHPDDKKVVRNHLNGLLAEEGISRGAQFRYRHKNGNYRWVEAKSTNLLLDPSVRAIVTNYRDITEQKKADEELKNSEERLRILFEYAPDAIFVFDLDGKVIDANRFAGRLTGVDRDEMKGRNFIRLGFLDAEQGKIARKVFLTNKRGEPAGPDEIILRNASGREIVVEIRTFPVMIMEQRMILCIARDITERKHFEYELIAAKEKAERADRLKDAFIANISHEIRSPLNIIMGYTNIMTDILQEHMDPEELAFLDSIDSAGQRLMRTVDFVLDISRLQAGDIEFNIGDILLPSLLKRVTNGMVPQAEKKDIELSFVNDAGNVIIQGDEYYLAQAIGNLVDNALKYTRKGSVTLHLYRREGSDDVVLEVKDSGIGIAEDYLPKLFEPYSQEENGYTRAYEGIGLGLALVKKYLDLHDASISVSSTKGQGTTFSITFPATIIVTDQ